MNRESLFGLVTASLFRGLSKNQTIILHSFASYKIIYPEDPFLVASISREKEIGLMKFEWWTNSLLDYPGE